MKNVTTKEFCREFKACKNGRRFALQYPTMRECYAALLNGEAGENSTEWAFWVFSRPGVTSDKTQRLFAVWCARSVQHLMIDQRSINAIDVAERYANGNATEEELDAAQEAALAALASCDAAYSAARYAAWAAALAALASCDAAYSAARYAACSAENNRLARLREIGNIFEDSEAK